MSKISVISLGGSLIIPPSGFKVQFLQDFKKLIVGLIKNGSSFASPAGGASSGTRFIIVCGGGATARQYQAAARAVGQLTADDVDWLGIHATRLNAHLMRAIFREWAHPVIVKDPTAKRVWREPVLIASGWRPGCSTDYDAVLLARQYGAREIFNLSNIDYVYDSDPRKNPAAKKFTNLTWTEFRKMFGGKWDPGANTPFDPVAARQAQKLNLTVHILNGVKLTEVRHALLGKKFKGTTII